MKIRTEKTRPSRFDSASNLPAYVLMELSGETRSISLKPFDVVAYVAEILNGEPIHPHVVKFPGSDRPDYDAQIRTELFRLVTLWLKSGPHTAKLWQQYPDMIPKKVECFLMPKGSRLEVKFIPAASIKRRPPWSESHALSLFLQLLTQPDCERLAGPCACGCGKFFINDGKYRKIYVRGHGSRLTSSKRMKEKQAEKRAPKVRAVNKALAKYRGPKLDGDWKEFVEGKLNFNYVTIQTLERWAEKGWIQAPSKRRG